MSKFTGIIYLLMVMLIFPACARTWQTVFAADSRSRRIAVEDEQKSSGKKADHLRAESISIEGIKLSMGITKTEMIKRLGTRFELEDQSNNLSFIVSPSQQPYQIYGSAIFADNRLISLSKSCGDYFGSDVTDLSLALIQPLLPHNGQQAVVTIKRSPANLTKTGKLLQVDLDFGNRIISLNLPAMPTREPVKITISEQITGEDILTLADKTLWQGMTREEAIRQLEADYLVNDRNKDVLAISSLSGSPIGKVYFKGGLLTGISRDLSIIYGKNAEGMTKAIYALIAAFNDQDHTLAKVSADLARSQGLTSSKITLDFGLKKISILFMQQENGEIEVLLQEELTER